MNKPGNSVAALMSLSLGGVSLEGVSEASLFEELCASTPSWAKSFPTEDERYTLLYIKYITVICVKTRYKR